MDSENNSCLDPGDPGIQENLVSPETQVVDLLGSNGTTESHVVIERLLEKENSASIVAERVKMYFIVSNFTLFYFYHFLAGTSRNIK